MVPKWLDAKIRRMTGVIVAKTLGRTSLTATELTLSGFALIIGSVWLLATGSFFWAGCLILVASIFDMLDGALARAKNEESQLGAFLDSTLDRYSEVFIFFGLLFYYYQNTPGSVEVMLVFVAGTGSLLISYARARAESLDFDCKVGLLERPERIVMIVFGLCTGWISIILWVLAILTHLTALQRILHVWRQSRRNTIAKRSVSLMQRSDYQ